MPPTDDHAELPDEPRPPGGRERRRRWLGRADRAARTMPPGALAVALAVAGLAIFVLFVLTQGGPFADASGGCGGG